MKGAEGEKVNENAREDATKEDRVFNMKHSSWRHQINTWK